jgi:GNAT superfamily N-acetyltransferase
MPAYRVRPATLDDVDVLVRHRIAMFTDMAVPLDAASLGATFHAWLIETMGSGAYRAWLADDDAGRASGGGGITIVPWPPGPRYPGDRLAFVYNVYTEPAHRRRGVARLVMETIHSWCAANGVTSMALNASAHGRGMYEAMGYQVTPNPMMFRAVTPAKK